jgi:hypothetical protein
MPTAVAFAVLGAHLARSQEHAAAGHDGGDDPYFDAFDVVVELEDGRLVVVGLRTFDYLQQQRTEPEMWPGGYEPLAVTLDFATVKHYDFNECLWLGPHPHPCLVWGNASGMRLTAIAHMLGHRRESRLLAGPNGEGLPSPESLGITVDDTLKWHRVEAVLGARR